MPIKTTQSETQRIPKLHFPRFSDGWEEKKLGDLCSEITYGLTVRPTYIKNGIPLISAREISNGEVDYLNAPQISKIDFDALSQKAKPKKGDLFLSKTGSIGFSAYFNSDDNVAITQNIAIVRLANQNKISVHFILSYFKTFDFLKSAIRKINQSTIMDLQLQDIKKLIIPLPISFKEQQKIAEFLGATNELINNLKEQKENLESYKKGMMQKVFSQEIRFKDEKGKEFTKLEYKKLGQICSIKKGIQLNREGLSQDVGNPVINGGIEPSGYTDTWNTKSNTITISEGGNSCGFVNFIKKDFWCGGHCYSLLDLNKNIDLMFLYQYLKFLEKNIMRLRVGSGLPNIQKKDIEKLKLMIPVLSEQQKIADFLNSVDKVIESKQQQITEAEQWKKGLMQGLFV